MQLICCAVLFDLDGVLVDSTAQVEHTWREWSARHGLDANATLQLAHGRRALDTVRAIAPHLDAAAEIIALSAHEASTSAGLFEVPGAQALIAALPPERWAVVTSGDRAVAEHRLRHVGLPIPAVMVCGDEVARGKPDPEGYLAAASKLGIAPGDCIVFEDAPSGIAAAHSAGMRVLALATTHSPDELGEADAVANTLNGVTVKIRSLQVSARHQIEICLPHRDAGAP